MYIKGKPKNYEVITVGEPSLDELSPTEQRLFYHSLYMYMMDKINDRKEREGKEEKNN